MQEIHFIVFFLGTQNGTVKEKNFTVKIDGKNYNEFVDKNVSQLINKTNESRIYDWINEGNKKLDDKQNKTNFINELTKLAIYLPQKNSIDRSDQDDESIDQYDRSHLKVQGSDGTSNDFTLMSSESRSRRRLDDSKFSKGNIQYDKLTNSSSNDTVQCSHECSASQFLSFSIRVIDPHNRNWATIMITSLYHINSLVMLCLLLGVSFHFIDLLIVSSFIEGGKLFVCFVLLMIDVFNGESI